MLKKLHLSFINLVTKWLSSEYSLHVYTAFLSYNKMLISRDVPPTLSLSLCTKTWTEFPQQVRSKWPKHVPMKTWVFYWSICNRDKKYIFSWIQKKPIHLQPRQKYIFSWIQKKPKLNLRIYHLRHGFILEDAFGKDFRF